jgi:hypothetical protein
VRLAAGEDAEGADDVVPRLEGLADVRLEGVYLERDDGRLVVVATVDGHPDEVRRWMTGVATMPGVETLAQT